MPIGVELRLYDGVTAQASLTGIQAMWWDVTEPKDGSRPIGKSSSVTTDANGDIFLDLSNVTGLSVGDYGFLMLYKLDATDHEDSLVFAGKVQTSTITSGVDMYYYDSGWTRPAGWLSLGTPLTSSDEKFVGLAKVGNHGSNFIAFTCAGAYTVDWGDGNAPTDYASGATAEKNLAYADYAGSECTHPNGESYRQALIAVTPQSGQSLTSLNLNVKHSQASLRDDTGTPWLDISISGPNLTSLTIGASSDFVRHHALEQVSVANSGSVTNFSSMFSYCYSLQSIPLLDTSGGTEFSSMFSRCHSLQSIPLLDTSAGTSFSSMFYLCHSLQSIPLIDTSGGASFSNMFYWCYSLQSIPLIDTSGGTIFSGMFSICSSLQRIPLLDTSAGINFFNMFYSCYSLKSIPLLDTSTGTNFSNMFYFCYSLQSIPLLNTSAGTNFSNMFGNCSSLQSIPLLNTSGGTEFSSMFYFCYSLQSIPLLNTSAGTNFSNMFSNCYSLQLGAMSGTKENVSYQNCKLGPDELNDIYTNLATVTSKTITVTGNWGTASDDPSIATAKGWTVTS